MAGNLNKVFLLGNLTRDPELRHTANGSSVASFSVAVNRTYKGSDGDYSVCYDIPFDSTRLFNS